MKEQVSQIIRLLFIEILQLVQTSLRQTNKEESENTVNLAIQQLENKGLKEIKEVASDGLHQIDDALHAKIDEVGQLAAHIAMSLLSKVILVVVSMIGLAFMAIAFALWIGELVNNAALGFLLAGLLWCIIGFVLARLLLKTKS